MSIGGLRWTLTGDSNSFSKSVLMARSSISAVKAALEEVKTPVERYRESFDRLKKGLAEAGVEGNLADQILLRMAQHSPAAVAARKAEAEAQAAANEQHRQAAAIIAKHQSAQERYAEAVRNLSALKAAGQFKGNEAAYAAELTRLKEQLPAIQAKRAAEREAAAAAQAAAKRFDVVATDAKAEDAARYADAQKRAKQVVDGLNPAESAYRKGMLEAIQLRRQQLLTEDQYLARKAQLKDALHAEAKAAAESTRSRLALPDWGKAFQDLAQQRASGNLSAREHRQGQLAAMGDAVSQIPGLGSLGGLMSSLGSTHPAISGLKVAWGAAAAGVGAYMAAAGAVTHQIMQQHQAIKELSTGARQAGMDLKSFIGMDYAARRLGVETQEVAKAMTVLERKTGEAQLGLQEGQMAFRALGLDWNRLGRMSPAQMFSEVQQALSRVKSPTEQQALATRLFGEEIKNLLPLLTGAKGSMADWMAEAGKNRLLVSDAQAQQVKDLYRAWSDVGEVIQGIFRQVAVLSMDGGLKQLADELKTSLQGATGDKAILYLLYAIKDAGAAAKIGTDLVSWGVQQVNRNVATAEISARSLYAVMLKIADMGGFAWAKAEAAANDQAIKAATLMAAGAGGQASGPAQGAGMSSLAAAAGAAFGAGASAGGSGSGLPGLTKTQQDLQTKVDDLTKSLREQLVTLQENSGAAKIAGLAHDGAAASQLAEARALVVQIESQKKAKEAKDKLQNKTREIAADLERSIATFGMSSDAVKVYELRQLGAADATVRLMIAAKNYRQVLELQKEVRDRGAETWFKAAEVDAFRQASQVEARGGRQPMDAAAAASERVAALRREYEIRQLIWRLQQEGTPTAEIQRQVALRRQVQEYDRQAAALERQKKLLEDARSTTESMRTPDQVYADRVRQLNEQLQAAGSTFLPTYVRARKAAAAELARSLTGGDRRPGVELVRAGTAEASDAIWNMQRQMAARQRAAAIDQKLAQEQLQQRGQQDAGQSAQAQTQAAWDQQLQYQGRLVGLLEQLVQQTPQLNGAGA